MADERPSRRRPTASQIRRRRRIVLAAIALVVLGAIYAVLALTVLAPADRDGAEVVHLTVHSRGVDADQGVEVVVPATDIDHGAIPIWNDVGTEDPFLIGDVAFDEALKAGNADLTSHVWHGGHEESYWDRHWKQYLRFYARALADC